LISNDGAARLPFSEKMRNDESSRPPLEHVVELLVARELCFMDISRIRSSGYWRRPDVAIALIAILLVFSCKVLVSNCQFSGDEELYYFISKIAFSDNGFYNTIFDHKPPLLYYLFSAFSLFSDEMYITRIVSSIALLSGLFFFFSSLQFSNKSKNILFSSISYSLISLSEGLGSNSELFEIILLLFFAGLLVRRHIFLAAVFGAASVMTRYVAAFDILGFLAFYLTLGGDNGDELSSRAIRAIKCAVLLGLLCAAIFAFFYLIYLPNGIDLFEQTITKNIMHSESERKPFEIRSFPREFLYISAFLFIVFTSQLIYSKFNANWLRIGGLAIWVIASITSALITGKYFYHYFIPVYIPLALSLFLIGDRKNQRERVAEIFGTCINLNGAAICIACASLLLATFNISYVSKQLAYNAQLKSTAARYDCFKSYQRVYFLSYDIGLYRLCNLPPPKYVFASFIFKPHFIKISGSRGMLELKDFSHVFVKKDSIFETLVPDLKSMGATVVIY